MILPLLMMQAATPAPAPPKAAPPARGWTPRASTDAATGVRSNSVSATSNEGNARLVVKCDSGAERVVSVQFISNASMGRGADRPVSMRVDGETPLIANWEFRGDKAAFIREDMSVTTLTTAIGRAHVIKIATATATGDRVEATFDGPAGDAPIRTVLGACGYVYGQPPVRTPPPAPAATPEADQ